MAYNPFKPPKVQTTIPGIAKPSPTAPWLLYAYPWMPYPRRVIIYMREKGIPEAQIKIVRVNDPSQGNEVVDSSYPPRPAGSLPILAIPKTRIGEESRDEEPYLYIRQSIAIMHLLEEFCNDFQYGFEMPRGSLLGKDPLARARISELMSLADECTTAWNPVRTFGTKAGTLAIPEAAKEMLRWVQRSLMGIERFLESRDMSLLQRGTYGHVTMADVVLYQFLEFVDDCYGVDVTIGSGQIVRDVYGREVEERYPQLQRFYQAFRTRDSARREVSKGEVPPPYAKEMMSSWINGAR